MLTRKAPDLTYADVTPRSVYLDRRKFLRAMGIVGATAVAGKGLFELAWPPQTAFAATKLTGLVKSPFSTTEKQNTFEDVTHYNNFYEFGTDKSDPAKNSKNFNTSSWSVSVEGEVKKPRKFSMDEILKIAPLEERIYRHRCVEAWSIVVPWIGFSFSNLINLVDPTPKAHFVGIWLLRQRESHRGPPALEPGQGAPPRRNLQAPHPDVQWLRRSGRLDVQRHGPEEKLLGLDHRVRALLISKWTKVAVFLLCLVPFGELVWRIVKSELGANPVEFIQHATGDWTLRFLVFTLCITPVRKLFKLPDLIRFRRMLGLFAFFYVCLHFLTYLGPDQSFDLSAMWKDVAKRPFITVGFAAFVSLIPLAITSTAGWIRRLGGKRWQMLHRSIS